ncbi:MAG: hypothetical protein H8E48_08555 [Chloroflexi bacterium]|nr:hypothetical protein [Chloroflexota bacterium]
MGYEASVTEGSLAVTLTFEDEMQIQILPAIREVDGIRILAEKDNTWSPVIKPEAFSSKLTEKNQECHGRLIPVIKLVKVAIESLPESIKPSGYHIESLAIEAFDGYSGPTNYKTMLQHFFERSSHLVRDPIRDSTGQSINVDQSMGPADSSLRQQLSGAMDRIARRMSNADRAISSDNWLSAIGE